MTKGTVAAGSSRRQIVDPAPLGRSGRFLARLSTAAAGSSWPGAGQQPRGRSIQRTGTLLLDSALAAAPAVGQPYELTSDEEAPLVAIRYLLGLPARRADPAGARSAGNDARHERPADPPRCPHGPGHHARLRRRLAHRLSKPAAAVRSGHPQAAAAVAAVVEIDERMAADGTVLRSPDRRADSQRTCASCKRRHRVAGDLPAARAAACPPTSNWWPRSPARSASTKSAFRSEVAPLVKIVPAGDTTVVDAYLESGAAVVCRRAAPRTARQRAADSRLRPAGWSRPSRSPARTASCRARPAAWSGFRAWPRRPASTRAIGFDMGGTSTDVSRFDGRYDLEYETEKAGVRVVAPMLAIETVAAGGGSICRFDGVKLVVGPDSAGADPGPACYGRGGPLTITDVNFFLGRIPAEHFPFPLVARRSRVG